MSRLPWLALLALLACSDRVRWREPTQVMARIESDATTFDQLTVAVFAKQAAGWTVVSQATFARADVRWPHDVAIVPRAGSPRAHMIEVVVQLEGGGMVLAKQRKLTTFVPHQQRVLSFDLWTGACNGASPVCEESDSCHDDACTTCIGGSCVPAPHEEDLPPLVLDPDPPGELDASIDADPAEDVPVTPDAADGQVDDGGVLDPCASGSSGCTGGCVSEAGSFRCTCDIDDTLAVDGKTCRRHAWGTEQSLSVISGSYISASMNAGGTAFAVWNEPGTHEGQPWNDLRGTVCTSYSCGQPGPVGSGGERNQGLFAHVTAEGAISWTGAYIDSAGMQTIKGRRFPAFDEQLIASYAAGSPAWFHKALDAPYVGYYTATGNPGLHTFAGRADGSWSAFPVYNDQVVDYGTVLVFPGGTVLVVWGEDSGTYWISRLQAGVWSKAVMLGSSSTPLQTRGAVDASGVAHVFYADGGVIRHVRVSEAGELLSRDELDLPSGVGAKNFYASAGTSCVGLVWTQGGTSLGVSTWSSARGWKGTDLRMSALGNPIGTPTFALSRNDLTLQVVWGLTPPGLSKQYVFSHSNDLGLTWSSPATVISTETPSQDLASDKEGRLMLVWSEPPAADGSGATRLRFFRE